MKALIAIATLVFLAGCQSRTEYGECVGLSDKQNPKLEYKVSARNLVVGIVFIELIAPPVLVAVNETYCPVGKVETPTAQVQLPPSCPNCTPYIPPYTPPPPPPPPKEPPSPSPQTAQILPQLPAPLPQPLPEPPQPLPPPLPPVPSAPVPNPQLS